MHFIKSEQDFQVLLVQWFVNSEANAETIDLLKKQHFKIRQMVARHPCVNSKILKGLHKDNSYRVRQAVCRNTNTEIEVLKKIMQEDKDIGIQRFAKRMLDGRNSWGI